MNSKNVLSKIAKMLSLTSEEVLFTDAKLADGTILQSPTFDVGESVEVVSEDGTKSPAPNGEHEISLTDSEGKEVLIKILVADGKITERENVELPEAEEESIEEELAATTEEAKALPNTTSEDKSNEIAETDTKEPLITLGEMNDRVSQLEKLYAGLLEKMESAAPMEGAPLVSSLEPTANITSMSSVEPDEDEELPKLDGAPIEPISVEANKNNYGKKSASYQSSVLSKMYR
jgi:hypothetical protein